MLFRFIYTNHCSRLLFLSRSTELFVLLFIHNTLSLYFFSTSVPFKTFKTFTTNSPLQTLEKIMYLFTVLLNSSHLSYSVNYSQHFLLHFFCLGIFLYHHFLFICPFFFFYILSSFNLSNSFFFLFLNPLFPSPFLIQLIMAVVLSCFHLIPRILQSLQGTIYE